MREFFDPPSGSDLVTPPQSLEFLDPPQPTINPVAGCQDRTSATGNTPSRSWDYTVGGTGFRVYVKPQERTRQERQIAGVKPPLEQLKHMHR